MDLGGVDLLSRASHKRRALEKKRVYEGHGHGRRRGLAWLDFFFAVSIFDHVHEENAAMACPELGRTT